MNNPDLTEWIDIGILDRTNIEKASDEHYRYRLLVDFMKKQKDFDDETLSKLVEILKKDEYLASTGYLHLLESSNLTPHQFKFIAEEFSNIGQWAKDKMELIHLKRDIENGVINDLEIIELIELQKPKMQHIILDHFRSNKTVLSALINVSEFSKVTRSAKHYLNELK